LDASLAWRTGFKRQWECHEDVSERSYEIENARDVRLRDQKIDVLGRPGRTVDGHGDAAANGIANARGPQRGDDGVELGDEVHGHEA
jgi:hypothetical protein